MPEGHAIGGIDVSISVIAPAAPNVGRVAAAIEHCSFPLGQVTWWVTDKTASITNSSEHAGAGHGITDNRVAVCIYSDAGHPPPQPVIVISPRLLLHRGRGKCAASNIELIPANAGWASAVHISANSTVSPQRFCAATILVNNGRHDFIPQGIQSRRCSLLRHKPSSGIRECVNEAVDRDLGIWLMRCANAESGVRWRDKIDMKQPAMNLSQGYAAASRAVDSQDESIPSRRRRIASAKGRGDEAVGSAHIGRAKSEADRVGRAGGEHASTV